MERGNQTNGFQAGDEMGGGKGGSAVELLYHLKGHYTLKTQAEFWLTPVCHGQADPGRVEQGP